MDLLLTSGNYSCNYEKIKRIIEVDFLSTNEIELFHKSRRKIMIYYFKHWKDKKHMFFLIVIVVDAEVYS